MALALVIALAVPNITVKASSDESGDSVTFYLEGPYTIVYSKGGVNIIGPNGDEHYQFFGLETLSDGVLYGMDTRDIYHNSDGTSARGAEYTAKTAPTTIDKDGWYTATVKSEYKKAAIDYLTSNYQFASKCIKFFVEDKGDKVYARQVSNHDWKPVTSATCQKKVTEKCSVCSATREVGSLAAHSYTRKTKVTQTQSCTNPEITRYYCKWCDDYEDKQTKAAKGHDYYVSANATIKHGTQHTCRTCGTSYYDNDRLKSKLSFNATVNGGTTSESNQECNADSSVSLTGKTACKDGWEFVGWNTDKTATTALSSVTMDDNRTVYAIFKKDITVKFVDG